MERTPRSLTALARCGIIAVVAACTLLAACRDRHTTTPHDVVLIVIDTLRADHLSVYGYGRDTSPNLARFARDAVTYENAISPATWTTPAHASLFTGRWPSYHGAERVAGDRLLATPVDPGVPMLAELLRTHGLHTAAFVGNAVYVAREFGFDRGFDEFFDRELSGTSRLRKAFCTWIPEQTGRLFVFVNILDPHEPYEPPPPFDTRFPGKQANGTLMTALVKAGTTLTPDLVAHFVSQYDGEIAFVDRALGLILAALKETGRYDDALVIVTSDHGELLGEHGLAGHGQEPYEGLVRVPLLVKYPWSLRAGERIGQRVSTLGVFTTILMSLDIPTPAGTQAEPLDRPHPIWVEDVLPDGRRVRVGYEDAHKMVGTTSSGGPVVTHLYDLGTDPDESRPIADETHANLRTMLAAFSAVPRPVNAAAPPVIDAEREVKLRALGYVR